MPTPLQLNYHKDPKAFRVGEMPSRAYFIPHESREGCFRERACSERLIPLTGNDCLCGEGIQEVS